VTVDLVAHEIVGRIVHRERRAVGERDLGRDAQRVIVTETHVVIEWNRRGRRGGRDLTAHEDSAAGTGECGGHGGELHERDVKERLQLLPGLSDPTRDNGKSGSES